MHNKKHFLFSQVDFIKLSPKVQMEELFDSIATQNAEIRTVAKSLPLFLK